MRKRGERGPGKSHLFCLWLIIAVMFFLLSFTAGCLDEIISETPVEDEQTEEEQDGSVADDNGTDESADTGDEATTEEPAQELPEAETDEAETDEDESEDEGVSPDYELLEKAVLDWLQEKTGDQDVVMVHTDELEDMEAFFERYDLAEENVIVYQVESTENGEATVLFGLPYSEWTMEAVFGWDGEGWIFMTEEEIQMGGQA
ncbi:MAG: hypothetical protein SVV67_10625 [Bacillota bacterium]|nr:hypothetical protein [Bacillota bacterium]